MACQRCNANRYNFITGVDPETGSITPLFNPREQNWADHFVWSADGLTIIGTTPTGRATCKRLDLNDQRNNERPIVKARRMKDKRWLASTLRRPTTRMLKALNFNPP